MPSSRTDNTTVNRARCAIGARVIAADGRVLVAATNATSTTSAAARANTLGERACARTEVDRFDVDADPRRDAGAIAPGLASMRANANMRAHARLPHLRVSEFDARPTKEMARSLEGRVALTASGRAKLAPLVRDGVSARTDLYIEAWDGRAFLLGQGAAPWKLRLKREDKPDGTKAYELSIAATRTKVAGDPVSVAIGDSTSIKLSKREGEKLFALGSGILDRLGGGRSPRGAARKFDAIVRKLLVDARLRDRPAALADLGGDGFRLVPAQVNHKTRMTGTIDGGAVGDIKVMLGKTDDVDPVTGGPRTRFELEAEPRAAEGVDIERFAAALHKQLHLDELSGADRAGDLASSEERTLEQWNRSLQD